MTMTQTVLRSLEQANAEALDRQVAAILPRPNGIACPECGAEMEDDLMGGIYTSNPPQVRCRCSRCGYETLRVL